MTTQVKRGKLGYEDVEFGLGTFQRYGPSGNLEVKTQIRASHIPILDALALYAATEVEAALAEVRGVIDVVEYPETVQRVEVLCTAPWEVEYTGVGLMHENLKDIVTLLNTYADHKARHIRGGADEVDGDLIDIDYAESTYTPAIGGVATHVDHLAAHLEGIDNFLALLDTFLVSRNLTDHRVLIGSGANPITPLGAMTDGQLMVGDTGADPSVQTVGGDATLGAGGSLALVGDKIIKAWVNFDGTGAVTINDSFNVASIADGGVGTYVISWDTDFASVNYVLAGYGGKVNSVQIIYGRADAPLAVGTADIDIANSAGVALDPPVVTIMAIGDQ